LSKINFDLFFFSYKRIKVKVEKAVIRKDDEVLESMMTMTMMIEEHQQLKDKTMMMMITRKKSVEYSRICKNEHVN